MSEKVKNALKTLATSILSAVVAFVTTILTNGGI